MLRSFFKNVNTAYFVWPKSSFIMATDSTPPSLKIKQVKIVTWRCFQYALWIWFWFVMIPFSAKSIYTTDSHSLFPFLQVSFWTFLMWQCFWNVGRPLLICNIIFSKWDSFSVTSKNPSTVSHFCRYHSMECQNHEAKASLHRIHSFEHAIFAWWVVRDLENSLVVDGTALIRNAKFECILHTHTLCVVWFEGRTNLGLHEKKKMIKRFYLGVPFFKLEINMGYFH